MDQKFTLPAFLSDNIEKLIENISLKSLTQAAEKLSKQYLKGFVNKRLDAPLDHLAYLLTRFPATYAAAYNVLAEIKKRSDKQINSLLDLGTGPGTVIFAALELFPEIKTIYLVEQDSFFIDFCKKVMSVNFPQIRIEVISNDIRNFSLKEVDLITCGYSLNELTEDEIKSTAEKIFAMPNPFFAVIEPGTPKGFKTIILMRELALLRGKFPLAPCPHSKKCPVLNTEKWCHFSTRLPRSGIHRLLKGGTLGFEDEKFSYFVSSNKPVFDLMDRVIGHPRKHSGHVSLDLCTTQGEACQKIISKKYGSIYKRAQKIEWGDTI